VVWIDVDVIGLVNVVSPIEDSSLPIEEVIPVLIVSVVGNPDCVDTELVIVFRIVLDPISETVMAIVPVEDSIDMEGVLCSVDVSDIETDWLPLVSGLLDESVSESPVVHVLEPASPLLVDVPLVTAPVSVPVDEGDEVNVVDTFGLSLTPDVALGLTKESVVIVPEMKEVPDESVSVNVDGFVDIMLESKLVPLVPDVRSSALVVVAMLLLLEATVDSLVPSVVSSQFEV